MATQTSVLQPYKPQPRPSLPGSEQRYLPEELQRIANTLNQIIEVMKQLDARMIAGGL